jgi:hypothetical protein
MICEFLNCENLAFHRRYSIKLRFNDFIIEVSAIILHNSKITHYTGAIECHLCCS